MLLCNSRLRIIAVVVATLSSVPGMAALPPLTGRVVDAANVIPAADEAILEARLAAIETATKHQLVVATIPSLGGESIDEYGTKLGRAWGSVARRTTTA